MHREYHDHYGVCVYLRSIRISLLLTVQLSWSGPCKLYLKVIGPQIPTIIDCLILELCGLALRSRKTGQRKNNKTVLLEKSFFICRIILNSTGFQLLLDKIVKNNFFCMSSFVLFHRYIHRVSNGQCVLEKSSDCSSHGGAVRARGSVWNLEKIGLDVCEGSIENKLELGLTRHFGHVVVSVHDLQQKMKTIWTTADRKLTGNEAKL